MFQKLVSHNDDLKRLLEKGYALAFDPGYLVIRDIPYLDRERKLQWGAIVTKVVAVDQDRVKQDDHQIFFAGEVPHELDGTPIRNLGGGPTTLALSTACKDVVVQRSFSNKPRPNGQLRGYVDFFEKIESYVAIISGPAINLHSVSPLTYRSVDAVPDSVFKVHDTLTSRAEINDLSAKFKDDVIAVIGLGGTGSYLLDFLVKTPVREIRAFDADVFHVHNAFRSPGKLDPATEFDKPKTAIYQSRYENFRHGLSLTPKIIDQSCVDDVKGVTFAFVCVDKGPSRAGIFDLLMANRIPFIDVGMGLKRKNGLLNGMVRTTYYSADEAQKRREANLADLVDQPEDLYRTNIQIAELNALNAALAILRFKQLRGFYLEEEANYNLLFEVCDMKIVSQVDEN